MKWQFIVMHTIRRIQISTLLDSWVTNTSSVKMLYPQKHCLSLYFRRNLTCLSVGLLMIGQAFPISCTTGIGGSRQIDFSTGILQTACSRSLISYGIE
jgi:hypothetical protein